MDDHDAYNYSAINQRRKNKRHSTGHVLRIAFLLYKHIGEDR